VQDQSTCLEQLAFLKQQSLEYLQAHTVAIDRGVVIAAQTSTTSYDLTPRQCCCRLIGSPLIHRRVVHRTRCYVYDRKVLKIQFPDNFLQHA